MSLDFDFLQKFSNKAFLLLNRCCGWISDQSELRIQVFLFSLLSISNIPVINYWYNFN